MHLSVLEQTNRVDTLTALATAYGTASQLAGQRPFSSPPCITFSGRTGVKDWTRSRRFKYGCGAVAGKNTALQMCIVKTSCLHPRFLFCHASSHTLPYLIPSAVMIGRMIFTATISSIIDSQIPYNPLFIGNLPIPNNATMKK